MSWARQRTVAGAPGRDLDRRHRGAPGHTLVRRPVQWPILPMVLARALESGPGTSPLPPVSTPRRQRRRARTSPRGPRMRRKSWWSTTAWRCARTCARCWSSAATRSPMPTASRSRSTAWPSAAFDCVLMDVLMPDIDGYEGCHQIKARLRGAQAVPVVMLTSKGLAVRPHPRKDGRLRRLPHQAGRSPASGRSAGPAGARRAGAPRRRAAPAQPAVAPLPRRFVPHARPYEAAAPSPHFDPAFHRKEIPCSAES